MPTDQLGEPASRRQVLKGAAGIGAAGLAATALTGVAGPALAAKPGHEAGHEAGPEAGHEGGPHQVVVHVRDASAGHLEVYSGTSQVHLRDKDLAERIVRASQKQVR
jgi:hypothetical protein